jgi:hypothetical protein
VSRARWHLASLLCTGASRWQRAMPCNLRSRVHPRLYHYTVGEVGCAAAACVVVPTRWWWCWCRNDGVLGMVFATPAGGPTTMPGSLLTSAPLYVTMYSMHVRYSTFTSAYGKGAARVLTSGAATLWRSYGRGGEGGGSEGFGKGKNRHPPCDGVGPSTAGLLSLPCTLGAPACTIFERPFGCNSMHASLCTPPWLAACSSTCVVLVMLGLRSCSRAA